MIQYAQINFEVEKDGRKYVFSVLPGSPYKDCCEALAEFSNEILRMARESEEAAKKQAEEKALAESAPINEGE